MSLAMPEKGRQESQGHQTPTTPVQIYLRPIAPPAALGLAGFAGSCFIVASYIAGWWGNDASPTLFWPFVLMFGGVSQFVAGLHGFQARDTLVSVINTLWGAFWISIGLLDAFVAAGAIPSHSLHNHFPELAAVMVPASAFTWVATFAAISRDLTLMGCLAALATGTTIACCLFAYNGGTIPATYSGDGLSGGVASGMKAAAYFWLLSALLAFWRVTNLLMSEAFGPDSRIMKFFPVGASPIARQAPMFVSGLGEPGVNNGVPRAFPTEDSE